MIDRPCLVTGLGTALTAPSIRYEAGRLRLGITIARQVPTALHLTGPNAAYLATKARRGGHDLLSLGRERAADPHRNADSAVAAGS